MELFSPLVGVIVQLGSGMFGIVLILTWQERKDSSIREIISMLKIPVALWTVCWGIGFTELCIRFL